MIYGARTISLSGFSPTTTETHPNNPPYLTKLLLSPRFQVPSLARGSALSKFCKDPRQLPPTQLQPWAMNSTLLYLSLSLFLDFYFMLTLLLKLLLKLWQRLFVQAVANWWFICWKIMPSSKICSMFDFHMTSLIFHSQLFSPSNFNVFWFFLFCFCFQDDSYVDSYISTIGVDFVSLFL